ncbi:MAG: aminotransferase class I/II-fold pyridoxal phosphate-dependent enzyme [Alphaproteobacteria bacterium]|nr:aminotransferase class I/II-fold pyridoxal phosphate-dependent enzyme [Alphaproteobacteria bacterium]
MSKFQPFVMERMMGKWENVVQYNLSESGVHPLKLGELMALAGRSADELANVEINYPQANGTSELRRTISAYYPPAVEDNVLVTTGAAEANYLIVHTLLEPGDEAVVMRPNYLQVWGVAKNRGAVIKDFDLVEAKNWAPDLDQLAAAVTARTKLIAVCNPNNPTGRILTAAEMAALVKAAERVGAWILADEVYAGAERETDAVTPTFYGMYDKVLAVGSMSKAYGLPGLRTGWVVGPANVLDDMWARHDYITITGTMLSDKLTAIALAPAVRLKILARTRGFIRAGYPVLQKWAARHANTIQIFPSQAAAIAFMRYNRAINSTELVTRLRDEKSVLIVPGDHFGHDHHLRISFGLPHDYLGEGLGRITELLDEIKE